MGQKPGMAASAQTNGDQAVHALPDRLLRELHTDDIVQHAHALRVRDAHDLARPAAHADDSLHAVAACERQSLLELSRGQLCGNVDHERAHLGGMGQRFLPRGLDRFQPFFELLEGSRVVARQNTHQSRDASLSHQVRPCHKKHGRADDRNRKA
ncbi:hypothetical protein D3C87_1524150 [compost metagenome]